MLFPSGGWIFCDIAFDMLFKFEQNLVMLPGKNYRSTLGFDTCLKSPMRFKLETPSMSGVLFSLGF